MSKLQVDDIVNKDDNGSVGFPGGVVTGVATATSFSGALTGNVTGNVVGNVTGNVTGNLNSSSPTGVSTVGVLTAYSSVSVGGTNIITAIDGKTSPGKAIALSMVFEKR